MACVYQQVQLPDDALSTEAAKDYAARLARESKRMVWLVLSRRISIRFDATGKQVNQEFGKYIASAPARRVVLGLKLYF